MRHRSVVRHLCCGAAIVAEYTQTTMSISRRRIVLGGLAVGGGLLVWSARRLDDGDARAKYLASTPDAAVLNAWVKIHVDGAITCGVHRAEMGQGVTTALPMLLAEELDADWDQVRFEFTPVDRDYFNFGVLLRGQPLGDTGDRPLAHFAERVIRGAFHVMGLSMTLSSTSIVDAWDTLRPAGAAARAMLIKAAARRWATPAERIETAHGEVIDPLTGNRARYGELAADAARERPPDAPRLREAGKFRIIGTAPARLDVPAKVLGKAAFGLDTVLPGMRFAVVRHSPLAGVPIAAVDNAAEVAVMPGVEGVVRVRNQAVAVVARDTWSAMRAAARLSLKAEATAAAAPDCDVMFKEWRQALADPESAVFRDDGDVAAALGGSAAAVDAVYELPYLAHACMEPMNCTALVEQGQVTVWTGTQAESIARDVAADTAGVSTDRVTVHRTYMGGSFGRRAEMDFVIAAVATAAAFPGRAVKLTYTREEDMRFDMYRPAAVARVRAALDGAGRIAALDYVLTTQSVTASYFERTPTPRGGNARKDESVLSGALNLLYSVPHLRVAFVPQQSAVPVGYWRSVGNSHNGFIVECAIDELAAAAGRDPVEFRLAHLADRPKHAAVLREAAARAGWGASLPPGFGRGVALIESHDSIVAQVVEAQVDADADSGALHSVSVKRVVCVIDCRIVVHPDIVVSQMQGGILDGLSSALFGRISLCGGAVEQGNFDDYRLLRLAESPAIEVHLLPQGGRPGGVGEPGLPAVAPALVNAIYAATGRRIRKLPLLPA
jgi:isoquinoline 1-oxidoreductase beta subunit